MLASRPARILSGKCPIGIPSNDKLPGNNNSGGAMNDITRRDFINGTLIAAGSSLLTFNMGGQAAMAAMSASKSSPTYSK